MAGGGTFMGDDDAKTKQLLREVGTPLWKRAVETADITLVGLSRVTYAIWLIFRDRAQGKEQAFPEDVEGIQNDLSSLERRCLHFAEKHRSQAVAQIEGPDAVETLRHMNEEDLWCLEELPPRKNMDRHVNFEKLLRLTYHLSRLIDVDGRLSPEAPATWSGIHDVKFLAVSFVYLVHLLFPELARRAAEPDVTVTAERIAEKWLSTLRSTGKRDTEILAANGLEVFGQSPRVTQNWVNSVPNWEDGLKPDTDKTYNT
jgi:hypothetical protein